jgi:hypothetical protein
MMGVLGTLFDFLGGTGDLAAPAKKAPLPLKARSKKGLGLASPVGPRLVVSGKVTADVVSIFEQEYRELRPRAPMPPFHIRFRRFVSLNTTIRLREGELHVSLSDLLEGAPESVLRAIAHILIAKIYKKPISAAHNNRYKRFQYSETVARQTEQIRSSRGAKRFSGPEGRFYNLEEVFDSLNERFFHGLLGRPQLTWSEHHAKRLLGHYDAAHNTIVVSKVFDRPSSPRYAVEYLLYHEMLHLKHPVSVRGTRRCVHGKAFKADEALFPQLREALAFLKRL